MGNETEFVTRNGREMGNKTEFKTRNGRNWETRREKIHNFSTKKREKKQEKYRGKRKKKRKNTQEKTENYKKYRNMILTRFRDMLKTETRFQQDLEKC